MSMGVGAATKRLDMRYFLIFPLLLVSALTSSSMCTMPSEAVLYTTTAAVHRLNLNPPCVWHPISCGSRAQVHICAEIDRYSSTARFRIVVWIQETGAVVVNDIISVGCRWWQSDCDDKASRRLTVVDGSTYGFQFSSATKATECSRIIDHVLANPGVLKVVKKLMHTYVDLQALVVAWQGVGLHSIQYPSCISEDHSDTCSSPAPTSSFCSERRLGRTIYPKQLDEISSSWSGQQQQEADTRLLQMQNDRDGTTEESKYSNASIGPEDDLSVEDDETNNQDDQSNGIPTSPVALLETGGALELDMETQNQSRGEWISRPYKTREEIHVTYDAEHARYEGLPDEWRMLNHQFGIPLEKVPKRKVEGYETKLPAVLEMMKTCFLAHNGARTEGVFRLAPDNNEYVAVMTAINDGAFEDCSDVHIMASLIKVWFRELPVSLFNMLSEKDISHTCELVDPEPKVVMQALTTLPSLHRSVVLWLLDLMNEVVKYEQDNKMTAKSIAIVMAPNLFSVENLNAEAVVTTYRQVAAFVQILMHARLQQRTGRDDKP